VYVRNGPNCPIIEKTPLRSHHPSEVCIRESICIWEVGAHLGCVAAASGSVIGTELY
jgi:hypothetical protein